MSAENSLFFVRHKGLRVAVEKHFIFHSPSICDVVFLLYKIY